MSKVRLALLSDLHAAPSSAPGAAGEVKLFSDKSTASATDNPMVGLRELVRLERLRADYVVCPGDMTNKANPDALQYVWSSLHSLGSDLQARKVIATVGNHDVDSRGHSEDVFPRESLMRLSPPFPAGDATRSDHYWAHGFYVDRVENVRFLVINSCWLHEARDELERGTITDYTLERIAAVLQTDAPAAVNIAVFHHHPHPHSDLRLGFDDVIKNGQKLLDLLSENAQWLIVHGHKHHPKIEYAQGQFRQPIVFASGSFSGRLEGSNALVSKNYFHLLEVVEADGRLAGKVASWNWIPGEGWRRYASTSPSFPTQTGFGCDRPVSDLADAIVQIVAQGAPVPWDSLVTREPSLQYLMPRQFAGLLAALRAREVDAEFNELGLPSQCGRRPQK